MKFKSFIYCTEVILVINNIVRKSYVLSEKHYL
jgi:hypothetical protein